MKGLLVKVGALVLAAALMATALVVVFGNIRIEDSQTYKALFADVSGLVPGSDVRAAGVTVGRVSDVEITDGNQILVSFTAHDDVPLGTATRAAIRYKNLLGDRYLELDDAPGAPGRLAPGGVIPASQTSGALDLDELYNGFAPLLDGLAPDQVNALSSALIGTFQGEGPAITQLLSSLGSLTGTVADRNRTIGSVIDNLTTVLRTANERSPRLVTLVDQLQQLVSGLSADRSQIGDSITGIAALSGDVGALLQQARPDLKGTVEQTDRVAGQLNSDTETIERTLQAAPEAYRQLTRAGQYGSFFQFYLCAVQVRATGPDGRAVLTPFITSGEERCS